MGSYSRVAVVLIASWAVVFAAGFGITRATVHLAEFVRPTAASELPAPRKQPPTPVSPVDATEPRDAAQLSTDLYGNEVSDAVATYKLDPAGLLYEEHSPNTELPRLAAPKG